MVIVFGSINLDLIFSLPSLPMPGETVLGPSVQIQPGGKGANQAVAAARDGATVIMVGAIGRDALGDGALDLLKQAGVDLNRVRSVQVNTGCAAISVDPAGNNAIAVGSGANLSVDAAQVEQSLLTPDATVVLQMEVSAAQTTEIIARARAANTRIVLNLAPAAALPDDTLRAVDVLVINETEAAWLAAHLKCKATAKSLQNRIGCIAVVLTLGQEGAQVATHNATWNQPAEQVTAVDTTAAGDCFVGVLANQLDSGQDLPASVRRASIAAALCCTRPGSQSSLPTHAETNAFRPDGGHRPVMST